MIQPPDFMPKVLGFMKDPIPKTVQGSSILPLLQGKKQSWRTSAVSASFRSFAQISDRRWLYGTWVHDHPPKLYDRRTDPDQKRDVLKKNPQAAKRLHRRLVRELKGLGSPDEFVKKINEKLE